MKKLGPIEYRTLFFKHVERFLSQIATSSELAGPHAVAVSGGLDSMTLLWFAQTLSKQGKIGPVRAIYVHHQTRSGQDEDQKLVEKFCREEGVQLSVIKLEGLKAHKGNFEARARKGRREACLTELKDRELLWVGHHLDDSFEWNFMQRFRSNNPKSTIGIPVRNRRIIRPFLCVTRAQIKKLSRFEGISYLDDPTNFDVKHDRNFVRLKIIPLIRERYPKYLKFYAHFANFSALMLNINLLNHGESDLFAYRDGAALIGKKFSQMQVQELIHAYSRADRGQIITPIERMLKAIDNGKKGPFHFSGGMEASFSHGLLMFYHQGMKNNDEAVAGVLRTLSRETLQSLPVFTRAELQIAWKNLLRDSDALGNLPGLVLVIESDSLCKTLNTSVYDPMFPAVSKVCQEKGLRFITFLKCLDVWKQKKEKLPERLRLVPLLSLSNLFPSQE